MKIRLLDYKYDEHFVEIPNDTEEIVIEIISGDMVMKSPIHFDTSDHRILNFHDGTVTLSKDKFHILDEITSTYDLFERIYENT